MSAMRFNAHIDTSHHGPPHPSKDANVVADSLTGIHSAKVNPLPCHQELHTQGSLRVLKVGNPEDSKLTGVESM
jgi:hypothetical protein